MSQANVKPRSGGRSHKPALEGVRPEDDACPAPDKGRLGRCLDLSSNIPIGDEEARARYVPGRYGFLLANGSMSSSSPSEGKIRQAMIEADLVDCLVALSRGLQFPRHYVKRATI